MFGKRDKKTDRKRIYAFSVMIGLVLSLDLLMGKRLEHDDAYEKLAANNWAVAHYKAPDQTVEIPIKPQGRKRILYISNSHAKTGGLVANHLQRLLDVVAPGDFEVLDMADGGIFAPDILQRTLDGLTFEPDLVIVGVAYISFSDRMKLSLQAHSVRSFFKDSVFPKLSLGFWLRNFDIGLYADTYVADKFRFYRYRNTIRNLWERPLVKYVKNATTPEPVLFLEVDTNQRWKFPDGYDNNLFQWNLYAVGREGHLADLRDATENLNDAGVPVLAFNIPIHWDKSLYEHDSDDYEIFRREIREIFDGVHDYVDYQDSFPKEFTTYDALHPTWYGARLHALDLVLRMNRLGIFRTRKDPDEIVTTYLETDSAISDEYKEKLDNHYPTQYDPSLRRYDITEPDNARRLMVRLASSNIGSKQEHSLLFGLSLRIRYWLETDFLSSVTTNDDMSRTLKTAVIREIKNAQRRIAFFQDKLVAFQSERLANFPVPDIAGLKPLESRPVALQIPVPLIARHYQLTNGNLVVQIATREGRTVAYSVFDPVTQTGYQRFDVLGDRSFLLIHQGDGNLMLPSWLIHPEPYVRFGI